MINVHREIAAELSRQEVILAQLHVDLKKGSPKEVNNTCIYSI